MVASRALRATAELMAITSSDVPIASGIGILRARVERGHDHEPATDAEEPGEEADGGAREEHEHDGAGVEPAHSGAHDRWCPRRSTVRGLADLRAGRAAGEHAPGGDHDEPGEGEQQQVGVDAGG